ncbi:MAG: RuBisCO large subunit C-terminal-like domain-containing protein [Nitrospirota bacterium]|nr:RuBisCO large subunit C-terminal-like domain-containing protein [Nitrospirota bacterium]
MDRYLLVHYEFPEGVDPVRHGTMLAIGQTIGSYHPGDSGRFSPYMGVLEETVLLESGRSRARVRYPLDNISGDIGSLLVMILGKYSLAGPVRVVSVDLPPSYGTPCRFGLSGIRTITGVQDRALLMGIFKPALGLAPRDFADILREVGEAGLDLIKDDEILPDTPTSTALERVQACRPVIDEIKRSTGREILYAVTLSGRADRLIDQAMRLRDAGANAYLLSPLAYGYSVLEALAARPETALPIFAHPAMAGALGGSRDYGFDYSVLLGTFMVHGGADAVLYPTSAGNLPVDPETERSIRLILQSSGVAPVPSAGVHPGAIARFLDPGDHGVILNAGTSIMDHPMGPGNGVKAFHEAFLRLKNRESMDPTLIPDGPLRQAILKWGAS